MGILTTLVLAWIMPHVWYLVFRTGWTSPGLMWFSSSPGGPITVQRRPFVDLYTFSPVDPKAVSGMTWVPSWVRTAGDGAIWARIDTAGAGWPMRAMASEAWMYQQSRPHEYRWNWHLGDTADGPILIPLRPIWAGFAVDAAVYSLAWLVVLRIALLRPAWWREGRRLRRGRCPACGYDLAWEMATGCPECGWRRRD